MTEREAIRRAFERNPELASVLERRLESGRLIVGDPPEDEVCAVVGGAWPTPMEGAAMRLCGECGAEISLAPSTQEMLLRRKGSVRLLCMVCMLKEMS